MKPRFKAGRYVIDESRGDYYLGTNSLGSRLYRRADGKYIRINPSGSGVEISELEAKRWFYRCHRSVHNFRWLYRVCWGEEWSKNIMRKCRIRRAA